MSRALRIAAAFLVLALAGCSQPTGTAPNDVQAADADDPLTDPSPAGSGKRSGKSAGEGKGAGGDRSEGTDAGGGRGNAPKRDEGGGGRGGAETGGATSLATGRSVVEDDPGDVYGDLAPAYTEIVNATITGKGKMAEVAVEVKGDIPDRVGERDNLLVGVGIEYEGKIGGIAVSVQGTRDGWTPGIQRDGEQRELEEGWRIDGNRFVWTVPWEDLGGARRFRWGASLRWFQFNSSDSTEADQAGDRAPDSAPASYPSKG